MPTVNENPAGTFCWAELGTTDTDAAKKFYTSLFGWTVNDVPMGPGMVYSLLQLNGRDVGALYGLNPDQRAQGVPPHWMTYVSVADADASAGKIQAHGGSLVMPPFDVADIGRMAVVRDPQGAVSAIWQSRSHKGFGLIGDPGSVCWNELMTADAKSASAFYSQVHGWGVKEVPMGPMVYRMLSNGDQPVAGAMDMPPGMTGVPPYWLIYYAVSDADAFHAKALSLGATPRMSPQDIPGVGRFTVLSDPQGANFAAIKLNQAAA